VGRGALAGVVPSDPRLFVPPLPGGQPPRGRAGRLGAAWLLTLGLLAVLRPLLLRWTGEHGKNALTRAKWPLFALFFFSRFASRHPSPPRSVAASSLPRSRRGRDRGHHWLLVRMTRYVTDLKVRQLRRAKSTGAIAMLELVAWALLVCGCGRVASGDAQPGVELRHRVGRAGPGRVAVAFAAQKTIENLFGTVTIIAEGAIRVGDRCQIGGFDGWVEDIGLRSTVFAPRIGSWSAFRTGRLRP